MGYRMGYIRALLGYGMVCGVAFQRVCLEEAASGGRAGLRAGSGFGPGRMGRVGVGPGSGPAGSGRAKLRPGWAGPNFGSGRGGLGVALFGVSEPCLIRMESVFVLFKITNARAEV